MTDRPAGSTQPAVADIVYAEPGDLAAVRTFVRAVATGRGLSPTRTEMLVLAVSELTTNTLQHTAGGGRVRMWSDDRQIVCEVVDRGTERPFGPMPAADSQRGRGLAIVRRVVDALSTYVADVGTVVQIRMNY